MTSWLKPNLYVIQNGKLVVRPTTPEQKKNYRYIPFDGFNNPAPQDYYRETISRLQKENTTLKNQIAHRILQQESRNQFISSGTQSHEIQQYQSQIAYLRQQLHSRQQELQQRNKTLTQKDKQILELGNQNTKLHLRINHVMKQLESLNILMSKKQQQILNKKEQIQQYCRVLDKLTMKQKQQQKTMASQNNYLKTPRAQQRNESEDEFYSIQCNSLNQRLSIDRRRYMTPQIQTFRLDNHQLYRSDPHINIDQRERMIANSSKVSSYKEPEERNINDEIIRSINSLANLSKKKSNLSIDLQKAEVDPIAGAFSSLLSCRK